MLLQRQLETRPESPTVAAARPPRAPVRRAYNAAAVAAATAVAPNATPVRKRAQSEEKTVVFRNHGSALVVVSIKTRALWICQQMAVHWRDGGNCSH